MTYRFSPNQGSAHFLGITSIPLLTHTCHATIGHPHRAAGPLLICLRWFFEGDTCTLIIYLPNLCSSLTTTEEFPVGRCLSYTSQAKNKKALCSQTPSRSLCHCAVSLLDTSLDRTFIAFLFTLVYGKLSEGIFGSFLYILFSSQSIFVWLLHASLRVSVLLISISVICQQGAKVTEPHWIPASPSLKWTYICKYSEYGSESRK